MPPWPLQVARPVLPACLGSSSRPWACADWRWHFHRTSRILRSLSFPASRAPGNAQGPSSGIHPRFPAPSPRPLDFLEPLDLLVFRPLCVLCGFLPRLLHGVFEDLGTLGAALSPLPAMLCCANSSSSPTSVPAPNATSCAPDAVVTRWHPSPPPPAASRPATYCESTEKQGEYCLFPGGGTTPRSPPLFHGMEPCFRGFSMQWKQVFGRVHRASCGLARPRRCAVSGRKSKNFRVERFTEAFYLTPCEASTYAGDDSSQLYFPQGVAKK